MNHPRRRRTNSTTAASVSAPGEQGVGSARKDNDASQAATATSRQLISVNNTVNTFIGGMSKSWMSNDNAVPIPGSGSVVRPQSGPIRVRKAARNPHVPDNSVPDASTTATSPTYIEPGEPGYGVLNPTDAATPIETARSSGIVSTSSDAEVGRVVQWAQPSQPLGQPSEASARNLGVNTESILPSPAPSKSPPGPEHKELDRTVSRAGQKRTGGNLESGDMRSYKRIAPSSLASPPAPSPPADQSRRESMPQGMAGNSDGVIANAAFSTLTVPTSVPPPVASPSQITFPGNNPNPPPQTLGQGTISFGPNETQAEKDALVRALLDALRMFRESSARRCTPLNRLENLRVRLLESAIKQDDLIFLLIHQVFTAFSVNPRDVEKYAGVRTEHIEGLNLLTSFLYDNSKISQRCLEFFAAFPWRYDSSVMQHPKIVSLLLQIRLFLSKGYETVARVRQICAERSRKLTQEEMQKRLMFHSPKLAEVFAISIRNMVEMVSSQTQQPSQPQMNQSQSAVSNIRSIPQPPGGFAPGGYFGPDVPPSPHLSPPCTPLLSTSLAPHHPTNEGYFPGIQRHRGSHISPPPTPSSINTSFQTQVALMAPNLHQMQQRQQIQPVQSLQQPYQPPAPPLVNPQLQYPNQQFRPQPQQQLQLPHPQLQQYPPQYQPQQQYHQQQLMHLQHLQQRIQLDIQRSHSAQSQQPGQRFPDQLLLLQQQYGQRQLSQNAFMSSAGLRPAHTRPPNPTYLPSQQGVPTPAYLPSQQNAPTLAYLPSQQNAPPRALAATATAALPENLLEMHLASPVMSLAQLPPINPSDRLHFVVVGFPVRQLKLTSFQKRQWAVSLEAERRLSRIHHSKSPDEPPARPMIARGCLVYRLRCVLLDAHEGKSLSDSEWIKKDTVWPNNIFLEVNEVRLEIRRKARWGKDRPVDITSILRRGENELKIGRLGAPSDQSVYLASIEVLECFTEGTIKSRLYKDRYLQSHLAKAEIMRRLSSNSDEDLIVSTNTVTVGVCCPLSFTLIELPVRAKECLHLECFDFHNYMDSRLREKPGVPPKEDSYKCPHCAARARPEDLLVDGFLESVLEKMRADPVTYEDVKSIVVDEKGDWEPKKEKEKEKDEGQRGSTARDSVKRDPARRDSTPSTRGNSVVGGLRKDVEVICIDD